MRIEDILPGKILTGQQKVTSNSKQTTQRLFASKLDEAAQESADEYDQEIQNLKKEIDAAGDKLEKEPNLNNFKNFRFLLSKLAKQISNEAYRLEKIGGTAQNPRYYEIITVINKEADELYGLLVNEQKNNMAITAKVIGIKGMIVDLVT